MTSKGNNLDYPEITILISSSNLNKMLQQHPVPSPGIRLTFASNLFHYIFLSEIVQHEQQQQQLCHISLSIGSQLIIYLLVTNVVFKNMLM